RGGGRGEGRGGERGGGGGAPADRQNRRAAEHRQPDVVDHLAGVLLEDGDGADPARGVGDDLIGERPQGDRTYPPDLHALRAALPDGVLDEARRRPEGDDRELGVVEEARLAALLGGRHARVFLTHDGEVRAVTQVELLRRAERRDVVRPAADRARRGPGLRRQVALGG